MPAPAFAEPHRIQQTKVPWALVLLFCFALGIWACGPSGAGASGSGKTVAPADRVILVAAERASQGGRLVRVSGDGARQSALTKLPTDSMNLDRSPVFTSDASHLVFVSNRGRENLAETSLWIVAQDGSDLRRLTEGAFIDRDPRISRDGKWLYFCSNREGSFDVYRASLDLAAGRLGSPEHVTRQNAQVLSPSLSPDGSQLSYMAVDEAGGSSIWSTLADGSGEPKRLSPGPMDMTPAWGADNTIAFASKAAGRDDADLFLMDADGGNRRSLIDAPNTDETGPRWSMDGRYVFAIGMYRSARDGKPLLGSVVFVDMKEKDRKLRALHDPSAVESRIGLALLPQPLDAKLLRGNASYSDALQKVLLQSAVRNEKERRRQAEESQK